MRRLGFFVAWAGLSFWSTSAFADARLNTDNRGCYQIEVRSFDIHPTRVTVHYSVLGAPASRFELDLPSQQSRFISVAPGNACLGLGDIKIIEVNRHVINPDGSIGSADLERSTENLIKDIIRRNQEIDNHNRDLIERRRLAREARRQRELELKLLRERSEAEARRIFALGREAQINELRRLHPNCIIRSDATSEDIALCISSERRIKEDAIREAKQAAEQAEKDELLAAKAAGPAQAMALHNEYLARAYNDPCWAVANYNKYHPIPETYAPTAAQIRAGLEAQRLACAARK